MILTIPPGSGSGDQPFNSPGEKGGFMLEGVMRLEIGKDFVDIQEGDAVQFDSSIPRSFVNRSLAGNQQPAFTQHLPRQPPQHLGSGRLETLQLSSRIDGLKQPGIATNLDLPSLLNRVKRLGQSSINYA